MRVRDGILFFTVSSGSFIPFACGTGAVGVDDCRQIETARCQKAPSCGISLAYPPHRDSPETDINSCIRFYRDACLHGLSTSSEPIPAQVNACLNVINTTNNCDLVLHPEHDPACSWLSPPPPDAAADAPDAADAADSG